MKVVLSESVLLIFVLNNHEPMHDDDRALFKAVDGLEYIVVVNKIDLTPQLEMDTVHELAGDKHVITTSLLEEEGIGDLEQVIRDMFFEGNIETADLTYVSNVRHIQLLTQSKQALEIGRASCRERVEVAAHKGERKIKRE